MEKNIIAKKSIAAFIKADAEVVAIKARLKLAEAKRTEAEAAIFDSLDKAVKAGEAVEVAREGDKDGVNITVHAHGYTVNLCRYRRFSFSSAKLERLYPGAYEKAKEWGKPISSLTVKPE